MDVPRGRPDAILRPSTAERAITLDRMPPSAALAEFVGYLWYVGWQVDEPHRQQVVPQPCVHIAAEDGRLFVHGISRGPFVRTLAGTGHTLGVAFHPGGFRPFLKRKVATLRDTVVPAGELFDVDDRPAARRILGTPDRDDMVEALEEYLLRLDPHPDPVAVQVRRLVLLAEEDRSVTRAEQLAGKASMSLRSLERLFADYVGIGPKWVISRWRILDAAAAAHGGESVDWAELALRLGFSDQAHLTRAFTAVVGTPPASYERHA